MREAGIRELKQKASEVLRHVTESGEEVTVTCRGKAVARLVPLPDPEARRSMAAKVWEEMEALSKEIGDRWPREVSAEQEIREQRGPGETMR